MCYSETTIRWAEKKDSRALAELCQDHALYEHSEIVVENHEIELSEALFSKASPVSCLVAENKKEIIGYATFMKQFATWDAGFYVYLDCLYLKKKARGKGLGNKIMQKVRAYAKSVKCRGVQWQTPEFNEKAIRFYKQLGATAKTKERFFWNAQ